MGTFLKLLQLYKWRGKNMNDNMNKNELKEKVVDYASKVFFYCVKSRMDAEDLSQTILLEIIRNIDNFDYYIWGVC